jgi:D-aminopeptidase
MSTHRLSRTLASLPVRFMGPGGAVAVLRDGELIERHAWGWADAERRIPFTPQTMSLICSISKQFTCALLLDLFPDPSVLDGDLRRRLPLLEEEAPTVLDLCHNQSGLRDYWATAMLCGAPVEGVFGMADADRLISRTRSLHFAAGTRYSYCNQNFRLLSDLIEQRTGQSYGDLLHAHLFDRAGMPLARLNADTSRVAGGTLGYEGTVATGFRPAVNHIVWTGDAGISASLDDMIAWEQFIDTTRDDAEGLYNRLSAPVTFKDGTPAVYGFGLARATAFGRRATCHEGGLRGWRSFRINLPEDRLSAVVLFNHMADPRACAFDLLAAALDVPEPVETIITGESGFAGRYLEPESGVAVRIEPAAEQRLSLKFGHGADVLAATEDGDFLSTAVRLYRDGDGISMTRHHENLSSLLVRCEGDSPTDIEGVFHSEELAADLTCVSAGGALYGAFSGMFGRGAMEALLPHGGDTWLLPMPRALDQSPPGDWTLTFERDGKGLVVAVQVGCWLARDIRYRRV